MTPRNNTNFVEDSKRTLTIYEKLYINRFIAFKFNDLGSTIKPSSDKIDKNKIGIILKTKNNEENILQLSGRIVSEKFKGLPIRKHVLSLPSAVLETTAVGCGGIGERS